MAPRVRVPVLRALTSTTAVILVLAGACNDDERGEATTAVSTSASASATASGGSGSATDGAGTASAGSATASDTSASATDPSAGTSTSGSTAGGSATDGARFDVGLSTATEGTSGDGGADECTKVDLLFVVDNSGSMADNQQSLVNSFPGFVDGIRSQLANAESYHVGVVTSDAYRYNAMGCRNLGDLVTQTGGPESSNLVCGPYTSGRRYMDQTEPALGVPFSCAARPGSGGNDDEKVMRSLLDAVSPAKQAPGACNEGFLRDDALLVVVIITDEDDVPEPFGCDPDDFFNNPCDSEGSGGTPQEWFDEMVAAKGGVAENVVVLALIGPGPSNSCGAVVNSKVLGFARRFGANGFTGDICASDYGAFFAEALPVVDAACENFVPPG